VAEVWRDGAVHVRAAQCGACLYSKDRLVSGERARQLTTDTRAEDGASFVCHRSMVSDEPEAICATWFERFAMEDAILRLAIAMDVIKRV
jgi:hypothetical protein